MKFIGIAISSCMSHDFLLDDIQNNVGALNVAAGLEEDHRSIEEPLKAVVIPNWRSLD